MNNTQYTLLINNDRHCASCEDRAIYILLGIENEFLGFYCGPCGVEVKEKLENKYNFLHENKWHERRKERIKKYKLKSDKDKVTNPKAIAKELKNEIKEKRSRYKKEIDEVIEEIMKDKRLEKKKN